MTTSNSQRTPKDADPLDLDDDFLEAMMEMVTELKISQPSGPGELTLDHTATVPTLTR